jgi:hypothetical protein
MMREMTTARTNMGTCAQKGRVTRPVSHALQTAPQTRNCRPKPYLTPARSFRDEKRKVDSSNLSLTTTSGCSSPMLSSDNARI